MQKPKPTKDDRKPLAVKSVVPSKRAGKKRKAAKPDPDYWFSLCVRQRANWHCECCGNYYEPWIGKNGEPANPGLHCSHYIGRANYATRFEPLNVFAHCYGCHAKFEGNPHEFREWVLSKRGQEKYDIIIEKSKDLMLGKQMRKEKQIIADHFKYCFYLMQLKLEKDLVGYL